MDEASPIQAYLAGEIGEGELLADVDRVLADGTMLARTTLLHDWRTKSGRIRAAAIREQLDARLLAFTSIAGDGADTPGVPGRTLRPGDVLARRFVIQEIIGSGGMGTVFKARDLRRDEAQDRQPYVAVKTLNVDVLRRDDSLKILQREARKAQGLAHPNIVRVYDFDRDDATIFLTMELLEGRSLEAMIQANGLLGTSPRDALPILEQVASALEFAHAEGIVHSDLKPANILILGTGRVKVIDFGIARAIPARGMPTLDRTTFDVRALGALTPAYASPEMIEGKDPDPRDDVFALACIAYELLTGSHPFGRTQALAARAANLQPRRPERLSASQWKALQGGLALDRSRRTASAKGLIAAMQATPAVWRSRGFAYQVGAGLAVLGAVAGLWAFSTDRRRSIEPATVVTADQAGSATPERPVAPDADQRQRDEAAARRLAQQQAEEAAARELAQQQAAEEEAKRVAQQQAAEEAKRLAQQQAEAAAQQPAPPQPAAAPTPVDIAEVQRSLNAIGLNTGTPDGKAGARTQEMVKAFQLIIGQPATGEATPDLLDALHRARPSAEAKAKSLFSLAAAASQSRRFGEAIRLYELGLTFAPANPDGLLALGDLYRDRNDNDGARRLYQLLLRDGGGAAERARERLAGLPGTAEAPAKPAGTAGTAAPEVAASGQPPAGRSEPGRPLDGTYVGSSQVSGSSSPNCVPGTVRLNLRDGTISLARGRQIAVAGDGTFSGTTTIGLPPVVQFWNGKVVGDGIELNVHDPACDYRVTLKRVSP